MFEWVRNKSREPFATLYESNITLNKAACDFVSDARFVMLGIAKDCSAIAMKVADDEEEGISSRELGIFRLTISRSYGRVTNRLFMEMIRERCKIQLSYSAGTRYPVTFDKENKQLFIDLTKPESGEI